MKNIFAILLLFISTFAAAQSGISGGGSSGSRASFPATNGVVCNTSTSNAVTCPSSTIQTAIGQNVYALPTNTVNGKAISTNPTLGAFDVGAVVGVVAGSSQYPQNSTSTTLNVMQTRIPFVPTTNSNCFQVTWTNAAFTTETGGPQFTMRAALEYPAGTFYPLFFTGHRDVIVDPKGQPVSDPACIDTVAGQVIYVRTLMQKTNIADQTAWPFNWTTNRYAGTTKLAPNVPDATAQFDGAENFIAATYAAGAITTATTAFTDTTNNPFTASFVGQNISIAGAGTFASCATFTGAGVGSGSLYCGHITVFTSSSAVTVSPAASATVVSASYTLSPVDKTTSGVIDLVFANVLAPSALLGQTPSPIKDVGLVGDSITASTQGDYTINMTGTWAIEAISQTQLAAGKATIVASGLPYIQASMFGETCANLIVNHQDRFALLGRTKKILGMLGTNDIFTSGVTAATLEACLSTLWQQETVRGSSPYYGTIVPQTTSTTGWLDTANQTVKAQEAVRIAVNGWLRDGGPYDCATGLPAATGSALTTVVRTNYYSNGALTTPALAGSTATCTHPAIAGGIFELADSVEMNSGGSFARNGGLWGVDPATRTLTNCSLTGGTNPVVTCTGGTFTSGDTGKVYFLAGGGQAAFTNTISFLTSTTATLTGSVPNTVSGAVLTVDGSVESCSGGRLNSGDGVHPWYHGHCLMAIMAAAAPIAQWTW